MTRFKQYYFSFHLTIFRFWDAGKYKEKEVDIIEKLPAGGERIRKGSKTEFVEAAINSFEKDFTVAGLEQACPGVS